MLLLIAFFALVFLFGGAILTIPSFQRTVIRIAMAYYGIPIYVDYSDARIMPGDIKFVDLTIIYQTDYETFLATIDTFSTKYSWGNPITLSKTRLVKPHFKIFKKPTIKRKSEKNETAMNFPYISLKKITIVDGEFIAPKTKLSNIFFNGSIDVKSSDAGKFLLSTKFDSLSGIFHGRGHLSAAAGTLFLKNGLLSFDGKIALDSTEGEIKIDKFNLSKKLFDKITFAGDRTNLYEVDSLLGLGFLEGFGKVEIAIENRKKSMYSMNISVDAVLWDIPINGENIRLDLDNNKGLVELSANNAVIWGAYAQDVKMRFITNSNPLEYHFDLGYVKNFDLANFDIAHTSLTGSAIIDGKSFGDDMCMNIIASLDKSNFEGNDCDSANMIILIARDSVMLGEFRTPSKIFVGGNTITLWGKVDSSGYIALNTKGQFPHPEFLSQIFDIPFVPSGFFSLDATISGKSEKLGAQFVIQGKNNGIDNLGLSLKSLSASGHFTDLENIQGDITFLALNGKYGGIEIESLYTSVTTGKNKLFFRPLSAKLNIGRLRAIGTVSLGDTTSIKIEGLTFSDSLETITLNKPIEIFPESGFSTNNLFISAFGGNVVMDTFALVDSTITLSGKIEDISLDKFSAIFKTPALSGNAKGHFSLVLNTETMMGYGGFNFLIAPFIFAGLSWNSLSAECKYSNDTLSFTMLHLRRDAEIADISGNILFADKKPSFDLNLSARGSNLYSITNFTDEIEPICGKYNINLSILGEPDSLSLYGNVSVDSASVRILSIDDPIDSIFLRGKFSDNKFIIDDFAGKLSTIPPKSSSLISRVWSLFSGKKQVVGSISAKGGIDFTKIASPDFNIDASLKNIPLKSTTDGFYFIADGELSIRGTEPKLGGDITILQGNLLKLGSVSPEPTHINFPIDLSINTNNLWLLTNEIEGKISGELFVSNSGNNISLLGRLDIENGKYFKYGQNFNIENGTLEFEKIGIIDPKLDILAKTTIGNEDIFLHITGTLNKPELEITSTNPDFTPKELLQLLAGTTDTVGVRDVIEDRTQDLLQKYAERQLENLARTTLGVDEIELEPATENGAIWNPSEMRLTVGKQVAGKLYIKYSQVLSSNPQQQIELQYRLSKNLTMSALEDVDKNYRLKLDLKWQY